MGSAAIDNSGNLAVGYSVSSLTLVPGIRYGGRSAAFTGGLDEGETTLFAGQGTQAAGSGNRWGDYSGLTVDPTDDCTFWYTNEYYPTGNTAFNWKSKVGTFTVATCTPPQQGTLTGTVTDCATAQPLDRVLVSVSGGPSTGFSSATIANGTYSMKLAPGTYQVTFGGRGCNTAGPFQVTVTNGNTTTLNSCVTGAPQAAFVSATVSGGNGNGVIDRNECNTLNVTISNPGCAAMTGVSAVLSSSTPGVTITQPNSGYPNIAVNGNGTNIVPFQINTSTAFVCGTPINFTLTVNSSQGSFTINFSMPTCTITGAGSIDNNDSTQTGRITRNGVASTCAAQKPFPGLNDSLVRHFDQYSFTNTDSSTACVTFTLNNTCGSNVFGVTYLGSYNPATLATNYLGDPGASGNGTSWSVNVPGGATVILVVHEVTANAGCAGYSFTVSGLPTDGGGPCPVAIVNSAGATLVNESCPPANNAIDPDERVTVNLKLMNIGGAPTSNLTATLLPNSGVVGPTGPQSYGAIPGNGGMVGRDFAFTASGSCGGTITATLQLQDGANNLGTVSYMFDLGSLSAPITATYSSGNIAVPINDFTTVDVPINVPDAGLVSDVNVSVRLNHTFDGDITMSLVAPDGTIVPLAIQRGGSGDNYGTGANDCSGSPTIFDDSAATAISAGTAPFAGSFRPESPLSAMNGRASDGVWKLRVTDSFAQDTGTIGCVQLQITRQLRLCTANCSQVRLDVTSTLTRTNSTTVSAVIRVTNIGSITANNVVVSTARLGAANGAPVPQTLGNIAPGATVTVPTSITFTNSTPGASSTLSVAGTYTGGTYSSNKRVTIP